jgi:hypothetical protein
MENLRAEYEQAVQAIAHKVLAMRQSGTDPETVARWAHAERQGFALAYKDLTPEPLRSQIRERTIATYGQAAGPSIDYADSAARPSRISL